MEPEGYYDEVAKTPCNQCKFGDDKEAWLNRCSKCEHDVIGENGLPFLVHELWQPKTIAFEVRKCQIG